MQRAQEKQRVVESFRQAWGRGEIPSLEEAMAGAASEDAATRRELLVQLVEIDLEHRWRQCSDDATQFGSVAGSSASSAEAGPPPQLEAYVKQWPELGPLEELPISLIAHEYRVRHEFGDRPDHFQYECRFPVDPADLVAALSEVDRGSRATQPISAAEESTARMAQGETARASQSERTLLPDAADPTAGPTTDPTTGPPPESRSENDTLVSGGPAAGAGPGESTQSQQTGQWFGKYRLLEELGSGAMGKVYKAWQSDLDRPVALKTILSGQLASRSEIDLFHAEARNAGRLRHPNIVRVFDSGEYDGQYYFSMDYVEGTSLEKLIEKRPLKMEQAARYMQTTAEAIHEAHKMEIYHRDLKPSNILIDNNDQPQVMDFGIAMRVKEGSNLTQEGGAVGTPSYMPPEQARGEIFTLGPTCDVYSLGATLYHLVTGRPPFLGPSALATMNQVLQNEPASPRDLNPDVDRDLETICLKCLEKDPRKRYAQAKELAEELGRYLRHEPIQARPLSSFGRFRKWCRRSPAAAFFSVTTALALVAATGVSVYGYVTQKTLNEQLETTLEEKEQALVAEAEAKQEAIDQRKIAVQKQNEAVVSRNAAQKAADAEREAKEEEKLAKELALTRQKEAVAARNAAQKAAEAEKEAKEEAQAAQAEEEKARKLAEANFEMANQAVKEMLTEVAQEELNHVPYMTDVRENVLKKAVEFYSKLGAGNPDKPEQQNRIAEGWYLLGTVYQLMGRLRGDGAAGGAATAAAGSAEAAFRQSLAIATSSAKSGGEQDESQLLRLKSRRDLGSVFIELGDYNNAWVQLREAFVLGERLLKEEKAEELFEHARTMTDYARLLELDPSGNTVNPGETALAARRRAVELHKRVADRFPEDPEHDLHLQKLAKAHNNLGSLFGGQEDFASAIPEWERAIEIQKRLTELEPQRRDYQEDYGVSLINLAVVYADPRFERFQEAKARCEQAYEIFRNLVESYPRIPHYRKQMAIAQSLLGSICIGTGEYARAVEALNQADGSFQSITAEAAGDIESQRFHAKALHNLGLLYDHRMEHKEAAESFQRAVETQRKLSTEFAKSQETTHEDWFELAYYHYDWAGQLERIGRSQEARDALREGEKHAERALKLKPDDERYERLLNEFRSALMR